MNDPIMGFDVDDSEIEFANVRVPITQERSITVMVTKTDADAGWGVTVPGVYDIWQPDAEPHSYKPWAKWKITEDGSVIALRIPESDTAIP